MKNKKLPLPKQLNQTSEEKYVIVGKLGSPYGVLGWIKLLSFTDPLSNILNFKTCYLEKSGHWEPICFQLGKSHGKGLVVKIVGIKNPEEARLLSGKYIAVAETELPPLGENEFYWKDLVGMRVFDKTGTFLGEVTSLLETGAHDVLIVKNQKEFAIPFLQGKTIQKVDLINKEIHVDWEII